MKEQISLFQYVALIVNFIISGILNTLPQITAQVGEQNTWMAPLVVFPIISFILVFVLGNNDRIKRLQNAFQGSKKTILQKCFIIMMGLFLMFVFIKDFRAILDFLTTVLLPNTPRDAIMVLLALTLIYMAVSGLEVMSRVTVIQIIVFGGIVLMLPFLLLNEIKFENVEPIGGPGFGSSMVKTTFLMFSWIGEAIIVLILFLDVKTSEKIKRGTVLGIGIGTFLFVILTFLDIAVLGVNIVKEATYPNLELIQQINITDFLDRLDLVIVTVWLPTYIARLALTLYGINKVFGLFYQNDQIPFNLVITPLCLLLGSLSVTLFKNNLDHLEYSFFSWAIGGMVFEFLLMGLLFIVGIRTKYDKKIEN
ncbi:endospore germination permease [Bacillus sp. DNRA2]|uniref:GerAB/ArcD/ProY family transporter n=1 Tax=Bacillus sp. DNRA2 TaxID=2723053 RepID=UPI00145F61D1|nr:endospore germination permease [Bacillus sp. DNRA2]NMD69179.1 endospore germination permease [Bacillus sp. DNRA2]